MRISAVIFDLDGTVLDNEDEYGIAFRRVLNSLGKKVDKKYPHVGGIGVKENWPLLLSKYRIQTKKSIEELTRETQDYYLKMLDHVTYKKGFENFVRDLRNSGIATALATSNTWWIVDEVSRVFDIDSHFDIITTGEEVKYKKPDSDLFLLTSQKLGVDPSDCLVMEDSQAGIEAARRAGMKAVGIAKDISVEKLLADADLVIFDFDQISAEEISKL
ncbi:MAG: HAD family hydrolase [Patescibacteria group bacterium]